tara:strand:- start:1300 stop:1644 length:345 start_codon:yes stop_codon:yes gene_type:complete
MTTTHTLHAARLKNNCPECFANDGLEFSFTQEHTVQKLYASASKDISEKLYCHGCKNTIYPVNWNDDIERVYEYHKKQAQPEKTGIRFTKFGYGLGVATLLFVAIGIALFIKTL